MSGSSCQIEKSISTEESGRSSWKRTPQATCCASPRPGSARPSKASAARCNCAGPPPFSFQLSATKPERGITRRVLVAWHIRIAHAIVARRPFNAPLSSFPSLASELLLISLYLLLTAFLDRNEPSAFIGMKRAAEQLSRPVRLALARCLSPLLRRLVFASYCCFGSNTFFFDQCPSASHFMLRVINTA